MHTSAPNSINRSTICSFSLCLEAKIEFKHFLHTYFEIYMNIFKCHSKILLNVQGPKATAKAVPWFTTIFGFAPCFSKILTAAGLSVCIHIKFIFFIME